MRIAWGVLGSVLATSAATAYAVDIDWSTVEVWTMDYRDTAIVCTSFLAFCLGYLGGK